MTMWSLVQTKVKIKGQLIVFWEKLRLDNFAFWVKQNWEIFQIFVAQGEVLTFFLLTHFRKQGMEECDFVQGYDPIEWLYNDGSALSREQHGFRAAGTY